MEEELKLREVREDEIPPLAEQARKYLPHTLSVHGLLSVGFRYGTCSLIGTRIYVPKKRDFPFFIVFTNVVDKAPRQTVTCYWNTAMVRTDQAKLLLESLPEWDWTAPVFFKACSLSIIRELELIVLGENGLCRNTLEKVIITEGHAYTISSVESKHYAISDEFFLAPLQKALATYIHSIWMFNYLDSEAGIRKILSTLPSMGVFMQENMKAETVEEGKQVVASSDGGPNGVLTDTSLHHHSRVVSWLSVKPTGEMGLTYTLPGYRRRGLAGAATSKLAQKLLTKNIIPYVNIPDENTNSIRLHEKIGFKKAAPFGWHLYKTKDMQTENF